MLFNLIFAAFEPDKCNKLLAAIVPIPTLPLVEIINGTVDGVETCILPNGKIVPIPTFVPSNTKLFEPANDPPELYWMFVVEPPGEPLEAGQFVPSERHTLNEPTIISVDALIDPVTSIF